MEPTLIEIDDFIGNHTQALSAISDFSRHKLIIKGSCGIGGTSAILNLKGKTVIIISPYTGMIASKEQQNENPNNFFIYEKSRNRWNNVSEMLDSNQHFILNTTPDQILMMAKTNENLFNQIKKIPLFIDECHIAAEADYRKALSDFNHIVFNDWEIFFTLSTATPVYHLIDLPICLRNSIQQIEIRRKNEPLKDITIQHYRQYQEWVSNELSMGRKVVLFSNDAKVYKYFLQFEDIATQPLVGKHLAVKVQMFKDAENMDMSNVLNLDNDLFIMSTKFITGYDFPVDASVGIISNEKSMTDGRYIPDIVQAYGRVRGKVHHAAIFYDRFDKQTNISDDEFLTEFDKHTLNQLTGLPYDGEINHTIVVIEHLPKILRQQTYNGTEELAKHLRDYGFLATIDYRDDGIIIPSGLTISDMVMNLQSMEPTKLKENTQYVLNNIQGDNEDYNGFGTNLLIAYAAAYVSQMCDNEYLNERIRKVRRYDDLVTIIKTFIDANTQGRLNFNEFGQKLDLVGQIVQKKKYHDSDQYYEMVDLVQYHTSDNMQAIAIRKGSLSKTFLSNLRWDSTFQNAVFFIETMYVVDLVKSDMMDENILQSIEMYSALAVKVKDDYIQAIATIAEITVAQVSRRILQNNDLDIMMKSRAIKKYFRHTLEYVYRNLSFQPTSEQESQLEVKLQKLLNTLCKDDSITSKLRLIEYSLESQKQHHKWYLLGMASLHIAGHMSGFKKSYKNHREYNIATKVSKQLRNHYTPYYMVEVDIISSNAQIIDKLFKTNIGLNVYDNLSKAKGISRVEAKVLYNSTLNNPRLSKERAIEIYMQAGYDSEQAERIAEFTTHGKIYEDMFAEEEYILRGYKLNSRLQNCLRCHDALIMIATSHHDDLPTLYDDVHYRVNRY